MTSRELIKGNVFTLICIFYLLVFCTCDGRVKKNKSNRFYHLFADKEWVYMSFGTPIGFKSDTVLTFKRMEILKRHRDSVKSEWAKKNIDTSKMPYVFPTLKFEANGNITYYMHSKNVAFCGDGLMELESGEWSLDEDNIILDVKGVYALDGYFHYKKIYQIFFPDSNNMRLKLKRIIVSKYVKNDTARY